MATNNIVSAVFENRMQAEQCVMQLRSNGVPDDAISIIAQHEGDVTATRADGSNADDHADNKGSGAMKGAMTGGAVGALFGLGAFLIPGVGPFITAGWLASTLGFAGGAAVSGAIVGATAGTLTGLMMNYGVSEEDAHMYEQRLSQGGVVLLVDTSKVPNPAQVNQVIGAAGGRGSAYMS